jgi:Carboxypeptidase regulatory-like domain
MKSFLRLVGTFSLAALFAIVMTLAPTSAKAQGISTGSMSGTVTDPTGAVVAGATVTAVNLSTGQQFVEHTTDSGLFALRSLPPGFYKVTVESSSFRTLALDQIQVLVSQDTGLGTLKLEIGQASEVITVEGASPLIEATTAQVTTSFSSKETADLPLNGGFDSLTLFIPGVADTGSNNFSNTNGVGFSSNGLRGRSNNFQIDGQSNNDNSVSGPSIFLGNQDVLEEVSVITNDFSVEYGRASGSIVNYVTKSGTNEFHGSGFEYWTGSKWDSHDNLETAADPIPRYVENRFGGTVGGPIKRNKAWFFFSPYFDRIRSAGNPASTGSALTPTPAGLTQLAAAFPGNPAVAALQAIGPYAVTAGNPHVTGNTTTLVVTDGVTSAPIDFAPIERNVPSLFNDREFTGRVDVQLTSKDRVGARYIFQQNVQTGVSTSTGTNIAQGQWVNIPARDQQIALDWTRTFSGQFVNQARYSFSRAGFGFEGGSFPNCTRSSIEACPTSFNLPTSLADFGMPSGFPQGRTINNTQVQDNASLVRGRHTFKIGGEFYKQRSPNTFLPNTNGTYNFSGSNCAALFPTLPDTSSAPCGFSRFLADSVQSLSLTDGTPKFNFKEYDVAAYFGDDWRVKDNLTINLGLRWEFSSQAINLLHDITVANQAGSTPFWDTTLPASVTTLPVIPNHYKYFGPNVGFAWKPHFFGLGEKTVIRGGFRITYDPEYYNIFLNVATSAPVVNAGSITTANCSAPCEPTSGFTGNDVRAAHLGDIPRGVNPGVRNFTNVASNFHEPYTQAWSLGVQQEINSKMVFETRYVGNRVVGNFQTVNANPSLAGLIANGFSSVIPAGVTPCNTPGTPGFAGQYTDCNSTNVRSRDNSAFSSYNGLQNELRIRNWHGLSGGLSYTFSKTEDNASEIFSTFSGGTTVAVAQNPFDISKSEKALSGIDFPHTASIYLVYDLPFFRAQKGFLGHLLGGYQINTTWRYSSGQPWTPTELAGFSSSCQTGFDNAFAGGASACRPFMGNPRAAVDSVGGCTDATLPDCGLVNYYTGVPTTMSAVRWIYNDDVSSQFFHTPFGNVGRNPGVRGDSVNTVNLSAFKSFKLNERLAFRVEAQVYNVLNHRFLGVPDPFIDDGNLAAGGTFANNFSNSSGGDYTNTVNTGLGRRRIILGGKFTF